MRLLRFARNDNKGFAMTGLVLILSAFFVLPILADDSEVSRTTLAGLQGVGVVKK